MNTTQIRRMEHISRRACWERPAAIGRAVPLVNRAALVGALAALLLAGLPLTAAAQDDQQLDSHFVVAARPQLDAVSAPVSPPHGDDTAVRRTFFRQGIFGICGGRSAWWGWVLGLAFYVPGLAMGAANTGQMARRQYVQMNADPASAGGLAFFRRERGHSRRERGHSSFDAQHFRRNPFLKRSSALPPLVQCHRSRRCFVAFTRPRNMLCPRFFPFLPPFFHLSSRPHPLQSQSVRRP